MKSEDDHPRRKARAGHVWVLPMILVLLSACGYQEDSAPVITGIGYPTPPRYEAGFNGGAVAMTAVVDFEDPDGDVVLLHVRWQDCDMGAVKELDSLEEDLQNIASGSIGFLVMISTNCPAGRYAARVSISDGEGNRSNVVEATYEIYE